MPNQVKDPELRLAVSKRRFGISKMATDVYPELCLRKSHLRFALRRFPRFMAIISPRLTCKSNNLGPKLPHNPQKHFVEGVDVDLKAICLRYTDPVRYGPRSDGHVTDVASIKVRDALMQCRDTQP